MRARRTTPITPTTIPAIAPVDRPPSLVDWSGSDTLEDVAKALVETAPDGAAGTPKKFDMVVDPDCGMLVMVGAMTTTAVDTLVAVVTDATTSVDSGALGNTAEDGHVAP